MIKLVIKKLRLFYLRLKKQQQKNNQTKPTQNKNMQHNLRGIIEASLKKKIKLKLSSRVIGPSLVEDNVAMHQR